MSLNKKILIIDDEDFIRLLLAKTLESLEDQGIELLQAADGQEGVELALQERPDLVISDVMMPRLDGFQACQQIKKADSQIHVILLTSKGQAMDKRQGATAGADEYVTKPFDPDYIRRQAAKILGLTIPD